MKLNPSWKKCRTFHMNFTGQAALIRLHAMSLTNKVVNGSARMALFIFQVSARLLKKIVLSEAYCD